LVAWRGWFPVGGELTSGEPDRKEGVYFGAELGPDDPLGAARRLRTTTFFGAFELDRNLGLDRLVEFHFLQVNVLEVAAHRVQLLLLDDDRHRFRALELEVEQSLAAGQDRAYLAFARLERPRLRASAVDDAGHKLLAAQAPRAARAEIGARCGLQLFASASHRTGEDRESREREPATT